MKKTDLIELKKTLKKDKVTITKMATCYVRGQDKETELATSSFLNLPEEEFYKYLELLKKLMSCKVGDTIQTLKLENNDTKRILNALRQCELKQTDILLTLCEQIKNRYDALNNYVMVFFYSAYDIPKRTSDKMKLDESEEVYNAIYCVICPVELSDPGLSYYENHKEFHNRTRDWIIKEPEIGFMYPDYNNKEINLEYIAYGFCNKKRPHEEISNYIIGSDVTPTSEEQAKVLVDALSSSLEDEDADKITAVTKKIIAKAKTIEERTKENDGIIKAAGSDVNIVTEPEITIEDLKETIIECGIPKEKAVKFESKYKELSSNKPNEVRVDKIFKKGQIKCEDIEITMPPEKLNCARIEVVNNRKCIVIELPEEDSEIYINGINCR